MSRQNIGQSGEDIAESYLKRRGLRIIGRNIKRAGVEADILARDGKTMVVVEVKTKTSHDFGLPQEMVGPRKQRQLRRFARSLLAEHGLIAIRVDVVAVTMGGGEPEVEHLINVVEDK